MTTSNCSNAMNYQHPNAVLMVFCKAPIPNQVKTRLIPTLSPEQACMLHQQLSLNALQMAMNTPLCPVQLWCSPAIDHDFFHSVANTFSVTLWQQQGNDLGERMHHAFCCALKTYSHALLIGCDCPSLTREDLEKAIDALKQSSDIVLGPAEDGGYVLMGLNHTQAKVFADIDWGTSDVLKQTHQQIHLLGLNLHELATQWDVDTPEDLTRYQALIKKH